MIDPLEPANDSLAGVVERAAKGVYKWQGKTHWDSLWLDGWAWVEAHPEMTRKLMEKGDGGVSLERVIRDHLLSLSRQDKARHAGYKPEDEAFYTKAVIEALLPMVVDLEAALEPRAGTHDEPPRGGRDPRTYDDFITSLIDVRRAWVSVPFRGAEYRVLEALYMDHMDVAHVAASFSMEVDEVRATANRGLNRLVTFLGGWPGRACAPGCDECGGGK